MNRKEEIIKAAEETSKAMWDFIDDDYTIPFKHGAQWADSHPVNQWHKAEDELPPVDKYRGIGYFSIETLFTDGKYMFVGIYSFKSKMWIDRDYCFPTGRITHWMELPELPKDKI